MSRASSRADGTAVVAADLPRSPYYKAPVYVPPPALPWKGFYVGINGAYSWAASNWSSAFPTAPQK